MSWDNLGGENKPKGGSQWGKTQKDFQEHDLAGFFADNKNKFDQFFGPSNSKKKIFGIIVVIFILWLLSGFYQINEGEEAVVLRFGRYDRTADRGLNYHLPDPIEKIIKERTGLIRKVEIGNSLSANIKPSRKTMNYINGIPQDNLVLTGDENILDINYVIQWKIKNLKDYIFNVANTENTVRNVSESALREVVGNNTLAKTYTDGRFDVETQAKNLAQKTLDLYKAGVEITAFQLMKVDPPAEVIDAFREVQNAKADKEREINLAQAYKNDILPRARGQAAKMVQEAEAYKEEVVANAIGETDRFNNLLAEYTKSKKVTKNRLYLDTMKNILDGAEKIIIDDNQSGNVVKYLPLPELNKKNNE